ncbi:MAG: hypothetical protein KGL39_07770 [Patescibacteria group bacterium]|nr:hypothetical protein [Patescibacteria group bacterium]
MTAFGDDERGEAMKPSMEEIADKLSETLAASLSENTLGAIKKHVDNIIYEIESDIEYRMKDELAPQVVGYVVEMAEKSVQALIEGNEDEMRRYLGCQRGAFNGRTEGYSWRVPTPEEMHPVIHGTLFERGPVELRKTIVGAHRDLLVNERILDLEDQVKSLVAQVNKANAEREKMFRRLQENGD